MNLFKDYNKHIGFVCIFLTLHSLDLWSQNKRQSSNIPLFKQASYQGNDEIYNKYLLKTDEFYNPILQGCYPDPSITKKGEDYFLVTSSFVMFPGVPIFHSKDLVNWKQIGHVLDTKSKLRIAELGISRGVYAPTIRYNPHNDMFYMITTQVAGALGNMIVKTKNPFLGWEEPIKLNFGGIDPSIFFDDDGKAYVVHNDGPKPGEELYSGHRVINIWEYDLAKDQVIEGSDKIIVNGGVDITKNPIWIEGPHMYKKNGKYYLMCAEGGTEDWHSEVIFVSDHPKGPYLPAANNPILTQRYLDKQRTQVVKCVGHADLIEGPGGKYYGVFLGVRPNEKNRVNTGRETFILPVDWSGAFPVFENGLIPMDPKLKLPIGVVNNTGKEGFLPNGNFTYTETFTSAKLDDRWIGLRGPREDFISLTKNGLLINPLKVNIKEMKPASILFYRQQHNSFNFSTTINYMPTSEKDLAGITCLQNEKSNYVFGITKKGKGYYIVLERNEWPNMQEKFKSSIIASTKIDLKAPIQLRVNAKGDIYEFSYSINGLDFVNVGGKVSGDILSTDIAGGFTSALIGLYATFANDALPNE